MKKPLKELISQVAKGAAPTTAVATSLIAPLAQAGPGDLDPAFADHGRQGPIAGLKGAARSIVVSDTGDAFLGGGYVETDCWYEWQSYCRYDKEFEATNYIGALAESGAIDSVFSGAATTTIEVFDIARQTDGKVVAAGRRVGTQRSPFGNYAVSNLAVFRLEADGTLDSSFGSAGIVEFEAETTTEPNQADALLVQPDGHIVVVGVRYDEFIVLRLNADGSFDESFGDRGIFAAPKSDHDTNSSQIVRVSSGGYRVATTTNGEGCRILGLTADGVLDASYGTDGYAGVAEGLGGNSACFSIAAQEDDRLLIAGWLTGQAVAVRLLANGQPDPSFTAAEVASTLDEPSAIAVAPDGRILVGGESVSGATVMRLQVTGELDELFGDAGKTTIDLPSEAGATPLIHDMAVRADGSVLVAGGDYAGSPTQPFAVRLLGDSGGESPGILSVVPGEFQGIEADELSVPVRRTGGSSGSVSVAYRTVQGSAEGGQDYQEVTGVLHWGDGDTGVRTVVVPILADGGVSEEDERFSLALSTPDGGAGLGTRNAPISIRPDGSPAGQFALWPGVLRLSETGNAALELQRNYYSDGEVCVTLQARSATAVAGEDFIDTPSTYCWDDQDGNVKRFDIQVVDDSIREGDESFTLELSNPTGGAVIGSRSTSTIWIEANDASPAEPPPNRNGGGGAAGLMSLLFLGLARVLSWLRRPAWKRRSARLDWSGGA
jgi:uncharacterized delta-60 repeat protein